MGAEAFFKKACSALVIAYQIIAYMAINYYGFCLSDLVLLRSQYTSDVHTQRLKKKGITISMDGKGRATDNICIERFWRSVKCEQIYLNEYDSIKALREDVDDYIDFYNYCYFHETLNYKKPMDVYTESLAFNNKLERAS